MKYRQRQRRALITTTASIVVNQQEIKLSYYMQFYKQALTVFWKYGGTEILLDEYGMWEVLLHPSPKDYRRFIKLYDWALDNDTIYSHYAIHKATLTRREAYWIAGDLAISLMEQS